MESLYNEIAGILFSLGINSTFYAQFAIFFVTYVAMYYIAFKPYMKAYDERQRRTVGNEKEAEDFTKESEKLEEQYSVEARKHNDNVKVIFNNKNEKATKEKASILEQARLDAEKKIAAERETLDEAISGARTQLSGQIPEISKKIEEKFLRS